MIRSAPRLSVAGLTVLFLLSAAGSSPAQNYEVRLKRAWVRSIADRTSVDVTMEVRHTHHSAKTVKSGGDEHAVG
jgi:hypothetical protein